MKKRVYDYICSHPDTSIHGIASVMDKPEMEVLSIVDDLHGEGYITLSQIVPLSSENSDSCRYSANGKQYSGD